MMETQLNYAELFAFIASKTKGKKLEILNNYLGLNSMQTLLIIPVFNANCDSDTANIGDIADYYDLSKLDILAHFSDLQFLKDKNYIIDSEPSMIIKDIKDIEFKLNENLYDAILHNRDIPNLESNNKQYNTFDFVDTVNDIVDDIENRRNAAKIISLIQNLEQSYSNFEIVNTLRKLCPNIIDRIVYYYFCTYGKIIFQTIFMVGRFNLST